MMNRREALARMGALVGGGWIAGNAGAQTTATIEGTSEKAAGAAMRGKEFTAAHITDVHVVDRLDSQKWFAESLHHVQSNPAKPSFILNTGDCVMDTLKTDRSRADMLWKMWRDTLKADNSLPIHSCLGNHDVWGLGKPAAEEKLIKNDPMFGKKLGLENLGLEKSYYSFDQGDWRFIALDSIHPTGNEDHSGWIARLDDEQFHWLETELKATPEGRHIAIISHVPIIQVCAMLTMKPDENHSYNWRPWGMFSDARRVIDLFKKHPNVKLCLSGHAHRRDYIEMSGVTYICDGAVSGRWWRGDHLNCSPGYSTITFKPDGTFDHNYTGYDWKATAADLAEEDA